MTDGSQYQTIAPDGSILISNPSTGLQLLNHHGAAMTLASPPLPPNCRGIPETLLMDGSDISEDMMMHFNGNRNGNSRTGSNGFNGHNNGSNFNHHIVTIHTNSSRGSSPTTDSSVISLVGNNLGSNGLTTTTTFAKPPVKSILKGSPATIKPFGYRDPRNSVALSSSGSDTIATGAHCPFWRADMV